MERYIVSSLILRRNEEKENAAFICMLHLKVFPEQVKAIYQSSTNTNNALQRYSTAVLVLTM